MSRDLFDEPRAKIARARKHLVDLAEAERAFERTQPVETYVGTAKDGNPAILIRANVFPSLEVSAIAGDVLNNLRSALDLTVSAACRAEGKTNVSKTYFVITSNPQDWDGLTQGKGNRLKAANPRIKALVRSFAPWKGGNDLLFAVSKLVGIDKHQALIALAVQQGGMSIDGLKVKNRNGNRAVRMSGNANPKMTFDEPVAEIFNFDAGAIASLKGPSRINVRFAFEAINFHPYLGAVKLLDDATREIAEIVEAFATASRDGKLH